MRRTTLLFTSLGASALAAASAWAGSYDLKEHTPAVTAALANRQARYDTLARQKAAGAIGEDNQGHVARLGGGSEVAELVASENSDREVLYQAIVEQNGLPAEAIATVRRVFAETQRNRAAIGDKMQLPSGDWTTK